jgi:8-oxo-dGTP pyrophosphatase MutT (NUDIX family)
MYKNRSNRNRPNPVLPGSLSTGLGLYCLNCGKANHTLMSCTEPFSSYGMLCFYRKSPAHEPRLVMVCRKHTIPYIDFLRGKYDVNNLAYVLELFCKMTASEIQKIVDLADFGKLRADLGLNNRTQKPYKVEYETSELKFNYLLKLGSLHKVIVSLNYIYGAEFKLTVESNPLISQDNDVILANMLAIITELRDKLSLTVENKSATGLYITPEWGMPKGKRHQRETDLQCSIREFSEESGIPSRYIRVFKNIVPLEELYMGMNNHQYRHTYFIGEIVNNSSPELDSKIESLLAGYDVIPSDEQSAEISRIQLIDMKGGLALVRPFHTSKKNVIQKAFYIFNQYKMFFYSHRTGY